MANKTEKQLAYDAGQAAITEPPGRRGPAACPFPAGSEERDEWLSGFADAVDDQPDPGDLRKALREARS